MCASMISLVKNAKFKYAIKNGMHTFIVPNTDFFFPQEHVLTTFGIFIQDNKLNKKERTYTSIQYHYIYYYFAFHYSTYFLTAGS